MDLFISVLGCDTNYIPVLLARFYTTNYQLTRSMHSIVGTIVWIRMGNSWENYVTECTTANDIGENHYHFPNRDFAAHTCSNRLPGHVGKSPRVPHGSILAIP